ncbi:hypothetical protein D3C72_1506770 [compost metagenome]
MLRRQLDLVQHLLQRHLFDGRAFAPALQRLLLPLQLLQQLRLQLGTAGRLQHLEQRHQGGVMLVWLVLRHEESQPLVELLQPEQRSGTFGNRKLETSHSAGSTEFEGAARLAAAKRCR